MLNGRQETLIHRSYSLSILFHATLLLSLRIKQSFSKMYHRFVVNPVNEKPLKAFHKGLRNLHAAKFLDVVSIISIFCVQLRVSIWLFHCDLSPSKLWIIMSFFVRHLVV